MGLRKWGVLAIRNRPVAINDRLDRVFVRGGNSAVITFAIEISMIVFDHSSWWIHMKGRSCGDHFRSFTLVVDEYEYEYEYEFTRILCLNDGCEIMPGFVK